MTALTIEHPNHRDQLYDLFVHSVKDFAIFLLDDGGRILTWNEGGHRVLGYTEAEIKDRHLSIFYTPEDNAQSAVEQELSTAKQTGCASDDRWLLHKDGRRVWVSGVTVWLHNTEPACYGKIIRDQTEARKKEERIETLNNSLHEKIRELERFEDATVGREFRMIELKRETERLTEKVRMLESKQ